MAELELLRPDDKPALLAISSEEIQVVAQAVLTELGYKVHSAADHKEFLTRYVQFQYQVVILEECFAAATIAENTALQEVQIMPMMRRRHSVFVLIGPSFQTGHTMQAFQQSVHMVINPSELSDLGQFLQKAVIDNDLFLNIFRDMQVRATQGK